MNRSGWCFDADGTPILCKDNALHYICSDCGISLGGEWPKNHVATCSPGFCDNCGKAMSLAHVYDWQLDSKGNRINIETIDND